MKWHPWHPHTCAVNTSSERMFDEPRSRNLEVQGFQNLARWLRQAEQASFSGREDPERSLCTLVLLKANLPHVCCNLKLFTKHKQRARNECWAQNPSVRTNQCSDLKCQTFAALWTSDNWENNERRSQEKLPQLWVRVFWWKRMNSSLSQNYQAFSKYIKLCTPDNVAKQVRERERERATCP